MTKEEFMSELCLRIGRLPPDELRRAVDFYDQAIDDRIEDGQTPEEAVAALGSMDDIVREIEDNVPLFVAVKARVEDTKKRARDNSDSNRVLKIALIILLSPIWLSLAIAGLSIVFGVLVAVVAVITALGISALALVLSGISMAVIAFILPYPDISPRLMLAGLGLIVTFIGLLLIPINGIIEKSFIAALKYTCRVVKKSVLFGLGKGETA